MSDMLTRSCLGQLANVRIVIVLPGLKLGGAERQALHLARYLKHEKGAIVHVCGLGKPGRMSELCDQYGISWSTLNLKWPAGKLARLRALAGFASALRKLKPDILLPYCIAPNVFCGAVWRYSGARLCVWNQRDEGRCMTRSRLERLAIWQTPWFIANSHHGAEHLIRTFDLNPGSVKVVYNGIVLEPAQADRGSWRRRLKVSDEAFLAVMVANLTRFKDHATLLRAWRVVVDNMRSLGREVVLLLAGSLEDASDALKALAYDLELGRSVRFLGRVDDISGLVSAVDLGVFSSQNEGCPNGLLECMAVGLPVVATDIPGIREAVGPEGSRQLVPPEDPKAFAYLVVNLAQDRQLCEQLGALNRQRVETVFGYRRMGEEMAALLSGWLGTRHPKGRLPRMAPKSPDAGSRP